MGAATLLQNGPRVISKVLTSADGTSIYADAVGDASKPSVVFVHGFGLSGLAFEGIFGEGDQGRDKWINDMFLVRYDLRGHGRSGKPVDAASWESKRLAEDFDAVVKSFGLSRPFIACWSLGGLTVTDILSNYPATYLSGVILLAGFPSATSVYKSATPHALALIPPFLTAESIDTLQATAQGFVSSFTAPESPPLPFLLQQAFIGNVMTQLRACTTHVLTRTQDETKFWEAGRNGLPMLVVNGSDDVITDEAQNVNTIQTGDGNGESWKDVTFYSVKGAGHMPFWERPEEVRNVVLEFVRRVLKERQAA